MNNSTDKNEHAKKVVNAWENFWYEHSQDETKIDKKGSSGIVEKIKQFLIHNEEEYNLDRWFKEILLKELPKEGKLCVLEAGCGEGKTAMGIWNPRFFMVALDISKNALQRTIAHSKNNQINLVPLRGSLFEIPCKDCSFDVILSVGVLEHFFPEEQRKQYQELARVVKENGLIYTFVPSFYGFFYRFGMWYAHQQDIWPFGYEKPMKTLRRLVNGFDNLKCIKEINGAFLTQFYYLMFFLRKIRIVKMIYLASVGLLNRIFWRMNHFTRGGYFILNIAQKLPVNKNTEKTQ